MPKKLIRQAFLLALGEGIYISLVALLLFSVEKLFGSKPDPAVIAPITQPLSILIWRFAKVEP